MGSQDKPTLFIELLKSLQGPLEAYCRRMLRHSSWVEDVLQSSMAHAYAKFDAAAPPANFKAWIFRFVTLEIFNRNRKHAPASFDEMPTDLTVEETWDLVTQEDALAALLDDPARMLEHFDDTVLAALEQLPVPERSVLLLRAIGELSYREIHELLAIPLGSVIGYLSRARKRLRVSLGTYAAECGFERQGASGRAGEGATDRPFADSPPPPLADGGNPR